MKRGGLVGIIHVKIYEHHKGRKRSGAMYPSLLEGKRRRKKEKEIKAHYNMSQVENDNYR